MRCFLTSIRGRVILYLSIFYFCSSHIFAQSIPLAQSIPYQQNFSAIAHNSAVFPAGWMGWTIGTSSTTVFNTSSPSADRVLVANSSASTSTGNIHNYNGKIGALNTGSLDLGLVLCLNTENKANILLSFDAMTIRNPYDSVANTRIRELALQYRTDTIGSFTNIVGLAYQNNRLKQNSSGVTIPQNLKSYSLVLPSNCDSQSRLQIRWVTRDVTGAGLRPSFAIDNIKVDTASIMSMQLLGNLYEELLSSPAEIVVRLSAPLSEAKSFRYSFSGSAKFGVDFTASLQDDKGLSAVSKDSGAIHIDSGTSVFRFLLHPINDTLIEGMESFVFRIEDAFAGYAIKDSMLQIRLVDDEPTPIHLIQGKADKANEGEYKIEAIVTGVFPKMSPKGFYIQEEDADADTSLLSSEGLFVVSDSVVAIGDKLWLSAEVVENDEGPSYGQCVAQPIQLLRLSSGNPLPKPTAIRLPMTIKSDWEPYEAMLLLFKDTLYVTNNEYLGKYGELTLSAGALVYQPTQIIDPNDTIASGTSAYGKANILAINDQKKFNSLNSILLDDGQSEALTTIPFINSENTLRVGSRIEGLKGILSFTFDEYRIFPQKLSDVRIIHQARPYSPYWDDKAHLKVASFNVLNYFNGDGFGAGFPTTRGASSLAEFVRQRDKIVKAIVTLNADVLGLIEIENDGTETGSAIQNLLDGINAYKGAGTYALVQDGLKIQAHNGDEIKCAILYKPAVLDTIGLPWLSADTIFNRPPLAQVFRVRSSDSLFCFIINHFKSKSCTDSRGADRDQADGQSCFNDTRKKQADALLKFINDTLIEFTKVDKIISMGDYNAYFEEDPLDTLRSAGFKVLGDAQSYSYLYQGQLGSLDNAVVSPALNSFIRGFGKWNINAVEPAYLGYEDDVLDTLGDETNFWSFLYTDDVFRCSDHDPVMVGLDLGPKLNLPILTKVNPELQLYPNPAHEQLIFTIYPYKSEIYQWVVVNVLGQVVLEGISNKQLNIIQLQKLIPGFYWMRITGDGKSFTRQFVKQ